MQPKRYQDETITNLLIPSSHELKTKNSLKFSKLTVFEI